MALGGALAFSGGALMLVRAPPPEDACKSTNHAAHHREKWTIHHWLCKHECAIESLPLLGPDSHEEIDAVTECLRTMARSGAISPERLEEWLQDVDVAVFAAKRALWYASAVQFETDEEQDKDGEATYHLIVARDQMDSNAVRGFACFVLEPLGESATLLSLCSLGGGVGKALIGYMVDDLPEDVRVSVLPSREWLGQTYYPKLGFTSRSKGADAVAHGSVVPSRLLAGQAGSCRRAIEERMH